MKLIKEPISPRKRAQAEYEYYLEYYGPVMPFAKAVFLSIINCRRDINPEKNFQDMHRIVMNRLDYISVTFEHRWLNSIIDTYVDHGDDRQRMQGMILSQYMCNIGALQIWEKSSIKNHKYVGRFNNQLPGMNAAKSDKFSNMFRRLDKNIVDDPFKTIWNNRFRPELDRNDTSWHHIAKYNGGGIYYSVREKKYIPQTINARLAKNILIWNDPDINFLRDIIGYSDFENIVIMNDTQFDDIDDPRIQYYPNTEVPDNDLVYDFVYFNGRIEEMSVWKLIQLNDNSIIAGTDIDANEGTLKRIMAKQKEMMYKVDLKSLYDENPMGWYISSRNKIDLGIVE